MEETANLITPPPPAPQPVTKALPPVKELFKQAWEILVASLLPILLLNLSVIVIYVLLGLVSGIIFFFLAVAAGVFSPDFSPTLLLSHPVVLIIGFLLLATLIIFAIFVGSLMPIGSILILDGAGAPVSLKAVIRKSLGLAVPLSLTVLLAGLLSFGGFFLLILPALLFEFFFMLTTCDVILGGRKYAGALRRSFYLVSNHFGGVIARVLLFWLVYVAIAIFIPNLIRRVEPVTGAVISFISFFVNILLGWYSLAFTLTLYKQVRAASEPEKENRLRWLVIISLLGWLLFLSLTVVAYQLISSGVANKVIEEIQRKMVSPTPTPFPPTSI